MKNYSLVLWTMKKCFDLFIESSLFWLPISLTVLLINHVAYRQYAYTANFLEFPKLNGSRWVKGYFLEAGLVLLGLIIIEQAIEGAFLKLGFSDSWVDPSSFLIYLALMVAECRETEGFSS